MQLFFCCGKCMQQKHPKRIIISIVSSLLVGLARPYTHKSSNHHVVIMPVTADWLQCRHLHHHLLQCRTLPLSRLPRGRIHISDWLGGGFGYKQSFKGEWYMINKGVGNNDELMMDEKLIVSNVQQQYDVFVLDRLSETLIRWSTLYRCHTKFRFGMYQCYDDGVSV